MLELYEANLAFHRELLTLGGNKELVDLITEIRQPHLFRAGLAMAHPCARRTVRAGASSDDRCH